MLNTTHQRLIGLFLILLVPAIRMVHAESSDAGSVAEMAARIDQHLSKRWTEDGIVPAELCSDSEYLRRVYLDLNGAIPPASEVRRFLEDRSPDKREVVVEQLLQSPRYALHMSNQWRDILLPEMQSIENAGDVAGLQRWMQQQFADNLPYDIWVGNFLVADRAGNEHPGVFYTALEMKPEKLAARTSQVFLGIQMQCAECHDHPFDNWTQHDFWSYAAFFARVQRKSGSGGAQGSFLIDDDTGEVSLPNMSEPVVPKLPHGRVVDAEEGGTRRQQLAIWMASRDNPYLSRALVNRVWAQMFGLGFVEPVDDMNPHNPPSHPELLDELALYFSRSGFDIRQLIRTLTRTQAYQRSSRLPEATADPRSFAAMSPKTLTPDQMYDSLQVLVAYPNVANDSNRAAGEPVEAGRQEFVTQMRGQSRSLTNYDLGVSQALMLMNGPLVGGATDKESGRLLAGLSAPFLTNAQRVDTLFLATLSRYPTDDERKMLEQHLQSQNNDEARRIILGDMIWAIVNSAEFAVNH